MKKRSPLVGSSGVALVVVLWAVTLISAAMLGLAALLQRQLGQEVAGLQNARAILVAESGIQMVLNSGIGRADVEQASQQLSGQLGDDWRFNGRKVPVHFEVKAEDFVGEEGRLNLNFWLREDNQQVGRRILQNLFASWDVDLNTQLKVIDALQDWVDENSMTKAQGAEREEYQSLRLSGPRNGPFERLEEVERVMGWRELARQAAAGTNAVDWHRKFTVFGLGKLSLLTADQDVLEAVLEMKPGTAKSFMLARKGPDAAEGTADDQVNASLLVGVSTNTLAERTSPGGEDLWRVTSTGYVGEAKRTVVALISRNPLPQIKARWTEDKKP
jgi:type II secretory pathway component PulK